MYANVAKCWQRPGRESITQRKCSETFGVQTLLDLVKPHGVFLLAPQTWVDKVPGVQVAGTPFMSDSAPHFNIPESRIVEAIDWVRSL